MMHLHNEELLKVLASETRLKVIEAILDQEKGMRFNEIARALEIYPSTLEDHLKRLVESRFIVHIDNRYLSNINTTHAAWLIESLSAVTNDSYFSTHQLSIKDVDLRSKFHSLSYEVYRDLLSILGKAKETFVQDVKLGYLGGSMNMKIEQGFFELWQPDFKETEVEAVFTKQGIGDLKKMEHPEKFIDAVDPSKTRIYVIDECDYAIGGCERGGFLFLPDLHSKVDFNSCLCFETDEGIKWLRSLFESLKARSQKVSIEELLQKGSS
ncbi:MAG: helix-turn-helix domain-containing protein [Candidatus Thorarchaeota archaeon]